MKKYLSGRCSLSTYKGMLRVDGHMGSGGIFFYDPVFDDYVSVYGKYVDADSAMALDKNKPLPEQVSKWKSQGEKIICTE